MGGTLYISQRSKVIINMKVSLCVGTRRVVVGILFSCLLCWPVVVTAEHNSVVLYGTLKRVINAKVLRVGVSLFTPWTMKNAKGELIGFEVDVAKQLAKDLGVKVELKVFAWKDIIHALEKHQIDIIVAGMTITPQRALRVNFSQPYAASGIGLATNISLTKDFSGMADLNRATIIIAAISQTVSEDLVRRIFPKAKLSLYLNSMDAVGALLEGKVHAYVEYNPIPTFLALDYPKKVDEPLSHPLLSTFAGFAVTKGSPDFINFLNAWITAHEGDGWLDSAHDYWFESVDWRPQVGKSE